MRPIENRKSKIENVPRIAANRTKGVINVFHPLCLGDAPGLPNRMARCATYVAERVSPMFPVLPLTLR
jgi:hypothetical protein